MSILRADLVTSAVAMAVAMRGGLVDTVTLHADRGCQYTSGQLARFAREHNLARSVGRTGVCWDNAAAESFWATLKVEFYDRYLRPSRAAAAVRSATGSSGFTTGADAIRPSV